MINKYLLPKVSRNTINSADNDETDVEEVVRLMRKENPKFLKYAKQVAHDIEVGLEEEVAVPDAFACVMAGVTMAYHLLRRQAESNRMEEKEFE